jgi:general secretion pathway protein J
VKQAGFTLVEMMVALFIFAMIAAAGVMLLSIGVRTQDAAAARLDDVADVRRMSVLLANDFAQIVPRTARDAQGTTLRAFTGNDASSDPLILGYVRGGRTNVEGRNRASVQRVDVRFEGGRLERRAYAAVDGTADAQPVLLADNVTALAVRYRDDKGNWRARWDDALVASLPRAVELTVTRRGQAPVTMAFMTGSGA